MRVREACIIFSGDAQRNQRITILWYVKIINERRCHRISEVVLILFTSTDKRNHKNITLKSTRSLFLYYYIYLCFWAMSNGAKHQLQFSGLRKSQRRESVTRYQKFVLILFTCSDNRKTQNEFIKNN